MKTYEKFISEALQTVANNTTYIDVETAKKKFKGAPGVSVSTKDSTAFIYQEKINKASLLKKLEARENKQYVTKGPYKLEINNFPVAYGTYDEIVAFINKNL